MNMSKKMIGIFVCLIFFGTSFIPVISGFSFNIQNIKSINLNLLSDSPLEIWNKTYGGIGYELGNAVLQTSDDGYILTGYTSTYGVGQTDSWLVKTDKNGNELWNYSFGGMDLDFTSHIQITSDGGYIMTGMTASFGPSNQNVWLIKTDESGKELWNKTYGGYSWDFGNFVDQASDGGYFIVGFTDSFGMGNGDAYLIKTDEYGNELWNKTYGGAYMDTGYNGQITSDGGVIIAGTTQSFGNGGQDVWYIKIDESGNELWNKTYGGVNNDAAYSIQQTYDGGYIITGSFDASASILIEGDFLILKTDEHGNELWNKTYGDEYGDIGLSVNQTLDGGYILSGTRNIYNYTYGWDIWIIKTDYNGNIEWDKTYGLPEFIDQGTHVRQTDDGGYIVLADTGSYGAGLNDAWLIKLASDNNPPNTPIINGTIIGQPGELYNYSIFSTDPNDDDLYYLINWSDGYEDVTGIYPSGVEIYISHIWTRPGTYTIKAKAIDIYGAESDWGELEVTMPKNKLSRYNINLVKWLLRFTKMSPFLR
jgi:hypothetical protein